jgi:hypothetical protein
VAQSRSDLREEADLLADPAVDEADGFLPDDLGAIADAEAALDVGVRLQAVAIGPILGRQPMEHRRVR